MCIVHINPVLQCLQHVIITVSQIWRCIHDLQLSTICQMPFLWHSLTSLLYGLQRWLEWSSHDFFFSSSFSEEWSQAVGIHHLSNKTHTHTHVGLTVLHIHYTPDHDFKVMQRTAWTANCCFETSILLFCLFTLPRNINCLVQKKQEFQVNKATGCWLLKLTYCFPV
jgi:hypothetical protein